MLVNPISYFCLTYFIDNMFASIQTKIITKEQSLIDYKKRKTPVKYLFHRFFFNTMILFARSLINNFK